MSVITTIDAKKRRMIALLGLALAALLVATSLLAARPAHAETTFTVNSAADLSDANTADGVCNALVSGGPECTLRAAIQQANATPGADTINFNTPAAPELTITDRVTIDGYTQPGASPNSAVQGTNAVLKIELDGTDAGSNGLVISAGGSGSVIKGLVINNYGDYGIRIVLAPGTKVEGNFLGTDPLGTIAEPNTNGGVLFPNSRLTKRAQRAPHDSRRASASNP